MRGGSQRAACPPDEDGRLASAAVTGAQSLANEQLESAAARVKPLGRQSGKAKHRPEPSIA
jgi:hypothetical protein